MGIPEAGEHSVHLALSGALRHELDTAKLVKRMLSSIGAWGTYRLRITEKIRGGPEHVGVEIVQYVMHASVCLKVQSGDNGTRFVCFLSSTDAPAKSVLDLLTARAGFRWREGDQYPPKSLVKTALVAIVDPAVAPAQVAEPQDEPVKIGKGKLSAYANDPVLRDIIVTALREKFGDGEFKGRDAHKIIIGLAGHPAPTTNATGQLIRRYCEQGHVVKTKTVGIKSFYRVVREEEKLQRLRAIAAEVDLAQSSLKEICGEEEDCQSQIESFKGAIVELEKRREKLALEKARQQAVIADPERQAAKAKLFRILSILKK